jgi:hypothetical protein
MKSKQEIEKWMRDEIIPGFLNLIFKDGMWLKPTNEKV